MHIFKVTMISSALAICFASKAFAITPEDTLVCPPVQQIQASTAYSKIRCSEKGECVYDLDTDMQQKPSDVNWWPPVWGFFMDFHAASQPEAKVKAEELLASLTLQDGPYSWPTTFLAFCTYSTSGGDDVEATAIVNDDPIR
ncbi:MAG: hypothetical protein V4501_02960 [Pseudomonadota bacterium]